MYSVEVDAEAADQVADLPGSALGPFAEVLTLVSVVPWSGEAYNRQRPEANLRTLAFGPGSAGLVIYLILEEQRRVAVLRVLWTG